MEGEISNQPCASISDIVISAGQKIGIVSALFKKVEMTDIKNYKARLGQ